MSRHAKLPKWAQDEIKQLQRDKAGLERRLNEAYGLVGETNVHVGDHVVGDRPLPKDARVIFTTPRGEIHVRHDGRGRLEVYQPGTTEGWLNVRPSSSNTLTLGVEPGR